MAGLGDRPLRMWSRRAGPVASGYRLSYWIEAFEDVDRATARFGSEPQEQMRLSTSRRVAPAAAVRVVHRAAPAGAPVRLSGIRRSGYPGPPRCRRLADSG